MNLTILLADDHKILRDGLKALLQREAGLTIVAEAEDGRAAVQLAQQHRPDIVIIDIGMPELNGIEATRQIIASVPDTKVIALSMHAEKAYVVEMLKVGAMGYLLKDSAFEELINALQAVKEEKLFLSPAIADLVIKDYLQNVASPEKTAFNTLTAREREVLQLLTEGKISKQIAGTLDISVKTIEMYRQQIMEKLDLHSVAELTKYAIREGITSL